MDKSLREFGQEMSHFMPKFLREFLKRQHRALASGEITVPQMIILNILKEKNRCMMSEIAKFLSVTTSAATGLVDRMVKSNLIKRTADKKDRRIIKIEMTAKGRRIIDGIQNRRYEMMMDIFGKLEPVERKRYLSTVKKIYRILTEEK